MFEIPALLVIVPALPLAAAVMTALLGRRLLKGRSHVPALIAVPLACLFSLILVWQVNLAASEPDSASSPRRIGWETTHTLWTWAAIDDAYVNESGSHALSIDVTLRADPLTAMMLGMVTFVSSLVVIYSIGYMHDDPGYWRFFSYVSLFVFSMTMLVLASNFFLVYVFWEAVGACSYLLIGFWYQKPAAAAAGKKAFLVNRVGDFGFALAVFLLWITYGTLNFHDAYSADGTLTSFGILGQVRLSDNAFTGGGVGLAICLLLLVGACGKSAQFPLHVWLPDAMEGPTPVSALIHAATMVTAGVYLTVRCTPLFVASPEAQQVVAVVGCFTALLAGIIALTQNDLKRVLAYSTVSQLGYMFLGVGVGTLAGVTAGMFHLFTHAFFKALLFLGAGSVMHAMGGVIDIRRFSGLRRKLPITCVTFLIGALALAGVFPLAGFWSKDAILGALHDAAAHGEVAGGKDRMNAVTTGTDRMNAVTSMNAVTTALPGLYQVLYIAALATAFLTAFYTFRAFFLTFMGQERIPSEAGDRAHESPRAMTLPLVILAAGTAVVGLWHHAIVDFLRHTPSLAFGSLPQGEPTAFHFDVAALSLVIALAGIGLAAFLYLGAKTEIDFLGRRAEGLSRFRTGNRLIDATAGLLIGAPLSIGYRLSSRKFFFDEIYEATIVRPLRAGAAILYWLDRRLVDGLVDFAGVVPRAAGTLLRSLQGGLVQFYALAMVLGALVLIAAAVLWNV